MNTYVNQSLPKIRKKAISGNQYYENTEIYYAVIEIIKIQEEQYVQSSKRICIESV